MKVKLLSENAKLPTRGTDGAVGYDLYAAEDVFIPVNSTGKIRTDISLEVPYGHVAKIEDRSGMAAKGLRTGAGVVDPDFRGNIGVIIHNINHQNDRNSYLNQRGYKISKGDRIAQILIYKVELPELQQVDTLTPTARNEGAFSSTGR